MAREFQAPEPQTRNLPGRLYQRDDSNRRPLLANQDKVRLRGRLRQVIQVTLIPLITLKEAQPVRRPGNPVPVIANRCQTCPPTKDFKMAVYRPIAYRRELRCYGWRNVHVTTCCGWL